MRLRASKELWSGLFGAVADLAEGATAYLETGPDGLYTEALDLSNVLHVSASLPPASFGLCEAPASEAYGVDAAKLKSFVSSGEKGGEWEVSSSRDEKGSLLLLKNGGLSFSTRLQPPEEARRLKGFLMEFTISVEVPADSLRSLLQTLRRTKNDSEIVSFQTGKDGLQVHITNGNTEPLASLALNPTRSQGDGGTWLGSEFLQEILAKLLALRSPSIRIEFANKGPARFTAPLGAGGAVSVLLAPREPTEEDSATEGGPVAEEVSTPPDEIESPSEVRGWEGNGEEANVAEVADAVLPIVQLLSVLVLSRLDRQQQNPGGNNGPVSPPSPPLPPPLPVRVPTPPRAVPVPPAVSRPTHVPSVSRPVPQAPRPPSPPAPNHRYSVGDASEASEEVIYAYTRTQAIRDGVLVDVSQTAREAGIKYPVALTRAVWSRYVEVPNGADGQDVMGRLWDVLVMFRFAARRTPKISTLLFRLYVRNDNRAPRLVSLKVVCGPGDRGEPVLTLMELGED